LQAVGKACHSFDASAVVIAWAGNDGSPNAFADEYGSLSAVECRPSRTFGGAMADIAQVLATYDPLVGVALGAGLTYGFGALNRRHVEKREEATRLYEARFQAYAQLLSENPRMP